MLPVRLEIDFNKLLRRKFSLEVLNIWKMQMQTAKSTALYTVLCHDFTEIAKDHPVFVIKVSD
jgi:hypothetical protein